MVQYECRCGIIRRIRRSARQLLSNATIASPLKSSAALFWLYFRFSISYRDVEEMIRMSSITLTNETIRT
jgi:hypothetical protein